MHVVCLHIINERSGFQNKIWKPFFYPWNAGESKERRGRDAGRKYPEDDCAGGENGKADGRDPEKDDHGLS